MYECYRWQGRAGLGAVGRYARLASFWSGRGYTSGLPAILKHAHDEILFEVDGNGGYDALIKLCKRIDQGFYILSCLRK